MANEMAIRRRQGRRLISEINMTPLIDVMLVLLVIFMITAPLITSGIKVDLPQAAAPAAESKDSPLIVSIAANGSVYIGDIPVELNELADKLKAMDKISPNQTKIFIKGDRKNSYGKVMEVMSLVTVAGFKKVVLITDNTGVSSSSDLSSIDKKNIKK